MVSMTSISVGSSKPTGPTLATQFMNCMWFLFRMPVLLLTMHRSKDSDSTWLVFDGLDTFTTIEFCGQFVGTTDNQFRQWIFDVSDIVKHCDKDPVLSLNFGSAPQIVDAIAEKPDAPGEYPP